MKLTLHQFGHKLGLDIDELLQQHRVVVKSERNPDKIKLVIYKCPVCKKEKDSLESVESHVANVHATTEFYHCQYCGKKIKGA